MWILVICTLVILSICVLGPYLRYQYVTRKCHRNKLLPGFKLKSIYQFLEFIDWILQLLFGARLGQIPKKKLIDEFQETLNSSVIGNHQHLLLKGFVRYIEEIDRMPMTLINRLSVRMELQNLIMTRQNVITSLKLHPILSSLPIHAPLIITGLPRTGSTMLYNLLNVDKSSFQTPKIWQMLHLIGNPTPSASKSFRQQAYRTYIERVYKVSDEIMRLFYSSHPPPLESLDNEEPEEDLLVLMHCLPTMACPYSEWMLNDKPAKAYYEYHCKYFQMLQLDTISNSSTCWLWKSPTHTLFINSLIETYPDARLIITHRHPFEVIPSLGKLYSTLLRTKRMPGTISAKEIGCIAFRLCKTMVDRMEAMRFFVENHPNIVHIHYSNLIDNPMKCLKRIYDHYGLSPISTELEASFQIQSNRNPQEKYGRMNYDLNEFGLTKNEIQTEFATYINWLNTILESS